MSNIARDVADREPFGSKFFEEYFLLLRFEFSRPYQEGLKEFYRRAHSMGFVAEVAVLEFVEV